MAVAVTVLFDRPQREIASLIEARIAASSATSIITGFATPGGLAAIADPIKAQPQILRTLVVGAATYPSFEALDDLIAVGIPTNRLHIHLGHTSSTGGRRNPFARYHPMLHSKVYYMEFPNSQACAFVGSHNLTSFALTGLNGEAAVMLEGHAESAEFDKIRAHVAAAESQAVQYDPTLKEAYAWWTREFIDGLRAEMRIPIDWDSTRTIVLFASADRGSRPKSGDQLYFEIPEGIEQIVSLKTEAHLFLFDLLPADPWSALQQTVSAAAHYTCTIQGVENRQGNVEVNADWRIDGPRPVLYRVPSGRYRPTPSSGKQQVRADVERAGVEPFDYLFERERKGWDPEYSQNEQLHVSEQASKGLALIESKGGGRPTEAWKLVRGLSARTGSAKEADAAALKLAAPESGSFVLVSVRRRRKGHSTPQDIDF